MRTQFAAALLAAAVHASAQAQLVGVGQFGAFTSQVLYSIDPATGAATPIGNTGLSQIIDLAWEQSTGRLMALTVNADLYNINPATGASTLIAARAGTLPEGAMALGPAGQLLATDADVLSSVNLATAALTPIAAITGPGGPNDLSGLAFTPTGLFGYAKNGSLSDSLVQIDAATGVVTGTIDLGFDSASPVGGLAFDAAGLRSFISDGVRLVSVDASGVVSVIGAHGVTGMSGLAVIPAPGSVGLLAVAGLLIARRRR